MIDPELIEILAEIEHERRHSWMRYMLDNLTYSNIKRWLIQTETPYAELSEREKDSDRKEVYKTLQAMKDYYGD